MLVSEALASSRLSYIASRAHNYEGSKFSIIHIVYNFKHFFRIMESDVPNRIMTGPRVSDSGAQGATWQRKSFGEC